MSGNTPATRVGDARDGVRPLPPKPSIELERKHAKALLRELRRGDPDAIHRAERWHPAALRAAAPGELTLADAQHIVAREYGFASWPRLMRYYRGLALEASELGTRQGLTREFYDGRVESLIREHGEQRVWAGRALASFVPRFYGRSIVDVLAAGVEIDDARLVIARQNRCTSWELLLERADADRWANTAAVDPWNRDDPPQVKASRAMHSGDLAAVQRIVNEHPEMLRGTDDEHRGRELMRKALIMERDQRTPAARRITDWLVSEGVDLTGPLNRMLLGHFMIKPVHVEYFLDRGADPAWMPPNGVSVLEHALVRYWDGEAVDLIAARVTPRRAFWIAAGLGDVDGVRRYLGRNGKPAPAAFRDRPPLGLMSPNLLPMLPEPDDMELLLEVMLVATLNARSEVIELLMNAGVPIDYVGWGGLSMLHLAVGNQRPALVEALVKLGADLDLKGRHPYATARELARQRLEHEPTNPTARGIVELCGLDPDTVLAEVEERRPKPPPLDHRALTALELAGDDAARLDQTDIRLENLFVGLLRARFPLPLLQAGGVGLERLRQALPGRVRAPDDQVPRPKLPLDPDVRAVIEQAVSYANDRRRQATSNDDVLHALLADETGTAAGLLVAAGGTLPRILQALEHH